MMKKSKKLIIWEDIPTYYSETRTWERTTFDSRADFANFVRSIFIEDGPETGYKFDESSLIFNAEARKYLETEMYCPYPDMSKDFLAYWDEQSIRNRKGIIVHSKDNTWYLPRDYYMWLNFLPIYHKDQRIYQFPNVYDGQYHTALYEFLGELEYMHAVILKKRQYAMSYYHMSKLINQVWFEEGVTLKLLAYDDAYIGAEGSWAFLNEYRDFLNDKTAWYRSFEPDKVGAWLQRIKTTVNGKDVYRGRKGRIMGITTRQSATKGVGGASRFIICEESGINPTLDKTLGFGKSALEDGPFKTTGQFIAYGSVGDLKQCDPLRKFMYKPDGYGFLSVKTRLFDKTESLKSNGLFVPETWNMFPFSDQYGNSDVKSAKKALLEARVKLEKELNPEDYQLEVSQHPLYIAEAFAWRQQPYFPLDIINKQAQLIDDGEFPYECIELAEDETGNVYSKASRRAPISEFPIDPKLKDKQGVIQVWERPDSKAPWGTYYSSIDPVATGATDTSRSLVSIIVYKSGIEVTTVKDNGEKETSLQGDKIVCTWTGRYEDLNKTHSILEYIIRWYNAWTLVEINVSLFIQHMIHRNMQHYLVVKDQILFLKEVKSNNGYQPYGWRNVGTIFKGNILPYGLQFVKEELDKETEVDGTVTKMIYGVSRIPDKMLLIEMREYRPGLNVDRLVAFCALAAFIKIQEANRGILKKTEYENKLEKPNNNSKFRLSPFVNLGSQNPHNKKRSPFKHYG